MATIRKFEDKEAWQKARTLAQEIYTLCTTTELAKDFKLRDQINASSGSIMDNIAEGFERGGKQEFIQFLAIARGSAGEVKSQLYRLLDRRYINKEKFEELYALANEVGSKITNWMKYLNKSEIKGIKFIDRVS